MSSLRCADQNRFLVERKRNLPPDDETADFLVSVGKTRKHFTFSLKRENFSSGVYKEFLPLLTIVVLGLISFFGIENFKKKN